jgi:hypothetical protein
MSHVTDWKPGKVSNEYRENWDRIFGGKCDDNAKMEAALKHFQQGGCCTGSCDCSMRTKERC